VELICVKTNENERKTDEPEKERERIQDAVASADSSIPQLH